MIELAATEQLARDLGAFRADPTLEQLSRLARGFWSHAEAVGGVRTLDAKIALLRVALDADLDDRSARDVINREVPGPHNFDLSGLTEPSSLAEPYDEFAPVAHEWRMPSGGFPVSTTMELPGWDIVDTLGVVMGNTVRTRGALVKLATGVASSIGGELTAYTSLLTDARTEAFQRLLHQAVTGGATGVIGLGFNTSSVFETAIEVVAFGTAVEARRSSAPDDKSP